MVVIQFLDFHLILKSGEIIIALSPNRTINEQLKYTKASMKYSVIKNTTWNI